LEGANTVDIALSVVAPVFNEEQGIESVIRYWAKVLNGRLNSEIVVTNDGSTDHTLDILQHLTAEIPNLRIVTYARNQGYGHALKEAIRASKGQAVLTLDSDGQFDLQDGLRLFHVYEESHCDHITGYRVKKNDSLLRVFADRALNRLVRFLFGVGLKDTNCAMKLIRGDLARTLNIEARGYPTPTEISVKLVTLGAVTKEEPVSHHERTAGQSKLRFMKTSISMFRFLLYLRNKIKLYKAGVIQTL